MTGKFVLRTVRNVIFRDHPYFAHLAITHRCNLSCRFCRIQEERIEELETEGMKRVIDVLDSMGVAVLSISGGGEPLLRPDFAVILNYAAAKGMYAKITSNGTMPLARYQELLRSGINEIAISLDGVQGNDLPFSHVGPKILQTIRYLNDHLPREKKLTLNITVSENNHDQVDGIVAYCTREFPNARLWLNPVVTGDGKLRNATQSKVEPDYLDRCKSPTLLTAGFYTAGAHDQYRKSTFDWRCRAGRMFFDIKPNGDFWICQDKSPLAPLNVLEPDFRERFKQADVSHRRRCSGCTYSCYFLTQKGFEPVNWKDMAGLWWRSNTRPDARCRVVAEKYGWFAGLLSLMSTRVRAAAAGPALSLFLALLLGVSFASGQLSSPPPSGEAIVERMEQNNEARQRALDAYQCQRRYAAANSRFRRHAEVTAQLRFTAPGKKVFRIIGRQGSGVIQRRAIAPLMEAERVNARVDARSQVDICRRNYQFKFLGLDETVRAYVFEVEPRTGNKYLFRGKIWVNAGKYAIQRTEGEPARSPSFWVLRTHFVHEYADFGGFWFPVRHRTDVDLRLFGNSALEIDYYDYQWQPRNTELDEKALLSEGLGFGYSGATPGASRPTSRW